MKLLALTFRYHATLALLVCALSVPLSYALIQRIVIQDVDEALLVRKKEIAQILVRSDAATLTYLPVTDPNVRVEQVVSCADDSFSDVKYYLSLADELEPHRELATCVKVRERWYRLHIRQSLVESEDFILTITLIQTGLFLVLLLGLGLVNRRITRTLWRPFYDALHRIRTFRLESEAPPVLPASTIHEFSELNAALTTLLGRNQAAYASQKQFTENASHEMQTPLAIISAELEMLANAPTLPEAETGRVQKAAGAVARLSQLNKSLLLLTKIENNQFAPTQFIPVGRLVEKLLDWYEDFLVHKNLRLVRCLDGNAGVEMNPYLAEILFGNLLRNAIRHTDPGGEIECRVTDTEFLLQNKGKPLPFPEGDLFQRFVKNPALPEATGLGLAIARQIAHRYGLRLTYAYDAPSTWHQFRVQFDPGDLL